MTTSFSGTKLTMEGSVYSGINLGQKNQNQFTQILWPLLNWSPGSQEIKCLIVQNFRPCFLFLKWNEIVTKSFPTPASKNLKFWSFAYLINSHPQKHLSEKGPSSFSHCQMFKLSFSETFTLSGCPRTKFGNQI